MGGASETKYAAFISYRHGGDDERWAEWLQRALETFRVPLALRAIGAPARLGRVFRDQEELAARADLSGAISEALDASDFLIVICSPRTPASRWVDEEVRRFQAAGKAERVLALLVDGRPEEGFPASLRHTAGGSEREVEPLAADARPRAGVPLRAVRRDVLLRLTATMLGVGYDDLKRRDAARRRRAIMAWAVGLVVLASGVGTGGWMSILTIRTERLVTTDIARFSQLKDELAARPGRTSLDTLHDAAAALAELGLCPRAEATCRTSLGERFLELGESRLAEQQLAIAEQLMLSAGMSGADLAWVQLLHAQGLSESGDSQGAQVKIDERIEYLRKHLGRGDARRPMLEQTVGVILKKNKKFDEADARYREARRLWEGLSSTSAEVLGLRHCIALVDDARAAAKSAKETAEARRMRIAAMDQLRVVWNDWKSVGKPDDPQALYTLSELAREEYELGRLEQATNAAAAGALFEDSELLFRDCETRMVRAIGPKSWRLTQMRGNLAALYSVQGRDAEAIAVYESILPTYRDPDVRGPADPQTMLVSRVLARRYLKVGRREDAVALAKEALDASPDSKEAETLRDIIKAGSVMP